MQAQCLVIIILIQFNVFVVISEDDYYRRIPQTIANGVELLKTADNSQNLTKAVNDLFKIENTTKSDEIFCETCSLVVNSVIDYRRNNASQESMITFLKKICKVFSFIISDEAVCEGYIKIGLPTILYIMDNKKMLTGQQVCAILYQTRGCSNPTASKWSVEIPVRKQADRHKKNVVNSNPFKILHLTDFHYDPLYAPGSNAACDLPLCCQQDSGPPAKPENAAGYWGDYHACDTPWYTITNFTSYITGTKEKHDYVYYTGDIISHRAWDIDQNTNAETIKKLLEHFKTTFKEIPIFPVLGNHESNPAHFFSPNDVQSPPVTTQWVFDLIATEWGRWLPPNTKDTILKGGYYTVLVKPGFRIIALNSNVCYVYNLWLLYEDKDPYDQLKWLVDVLTEAEENHEKVHILSHVPPGSAECYQPWTEQFAKIVNRFSKTISAQFNGHTHLDELRLFRDVNDSKKIINVAFNGGSFTTFVGYNPNYRTYDVSPNNYSVVDYHQYIFNLSKANLDPKTSPRWYKLYSFKHAYGLKNMSYKGLAELNQRMLKDTALVHKYYKYQGRESIASLAQKCDKTCLLRTLCSITAVEAKQAIQCDLINTDNETSTNYQSKDDATIAASSPLLVMITILYLLIIRL